MTDSVKESETYGAMLKEVEGIVSAIGNNSLDLDSMVQQVERGYTLIKAMRSRLDETKEKIEQLRAEYTSAPE